jgi:hypothetical protein
MDNIIAFILTIPEYKYARIVIAANRRGLTTTEYLQRTLNFGLKCMELAESSTSKLITEENNKQREVVGESWTTQSR